MLPHGWVATFFFFFIHAAGILWGNMMGQGEEGRRGESSPKCSGCAFLALRWLHSGRYKLTGSGGGSHANEVRVGSSVAFFILPSGLENVGVHVKTALWGSSDMWGCLAQTQHIITQSVWQRYRANLYVTVPEQLLRAHWAQTSFPSAFGCMQIVLCHLLLCWANTGCGHGKENLLLHS